MQAMSLSSQQERAYSRFGQALLAFSDDPSTINWARYLAASQALDDARAAEEGQLAMSAVSDDPSGNQKGEA
jgi:hypothetical protein